MRRLASIVIATFCLGVPGAAKAQGTWAGASFAPGTAPATDAGRQRSPTAAGPRPQRQPKPPLRIGVRVFGILDAESLLASQTFKATVNSAFLLGGGAGGDIAFGPFFGRVTFAAGRKSGTRVFIDGSNVISFGIPLRVSLTPIEFGGGIRFAGHGRTPPSIIPYAGATFLLLRYHETSTGASSTDDVSQTFKGVGLFGGIELPIGSRLTFGGEFEYRSVANAIGSSPTSVASFFNESNLGGYTARVMFGVRFGRF